MDKINKIKEIKNAICSYYNIAECEVDSRSRKAEIVKVRHLILYMTRYEMGITFREIGSILHKEVSTVVRNF